MYQVEDLEYIDYLQYRRDAFIHLHNKTDEGREYLKNAMTLSKTEPDRPRLRDLSKKG